MSETEYYLCSDCKWPSTSDHFKNCYCHQEKPKICQVTDTAVGDVNSMERGSGARANEGKTRWDLMLFRDIAWLGRQELEKTMPVTTDEVWDSMGKFQETHMKSDALYLLADAVRFGMGQDKDVWGYLDMVCGVWEIGASKYSSWNWATGMAWSHPLASMARHLVALEKGERNDPETGLYHSAHIGCNAFMLTHLARYFPDLNDLPPKELFAAPE